MGAADDGIEPIRYSVLYEHVPDMVESGVLPDALRARVPGDPKATYTLDKRVMGVYAHAHAHMHVPHGRAYHGSRVGSRALALSPSPKP